MSGEISQLKAYLRTFKIVRLDPVVGFETAPGQQMQADSTTIRRGRDRLLLYTKLGTREDVFHFDIAVKVII